MNMTYKTQITISADAQTTWDYMTQTNFVKDYFPEIKKDLSGMSEYVHHTHRSRDRTLPSYLIPDKAIGWTDGAGVTIRLPRKDVNANIEAVDLLLEAHGKNTKVTIEVAYNPKLGKNFILANRCIRGLFSIKLKVLKQDLEADNKQVENIPVFA